MSSIIQFFRTHPHPRLLVAVSLGLISGFLLPEHWRLVTQILMGWNIMVWSYLSLMAWLMLRADHVRVIKIANQEDEHGATILAMFSIATVASLVAIMLELSTQELTPGLRLFHYLLTGATIMGSWLFIGVLFTFHYSRMYYLSPTSHRALQFPDGEQSPDYWDFLYFAFTIAVAAQTADVSVMGRSLRKVVLAQSILSFLFNVAIIGLSINVMASLIG
ncbi:MAG: DUF1345 domain-containing protein [Methylovulum sp.]|uniref:DUF1345 domain-containing protein n=1 Tax=Methylovulum sp. TaxID=1916980 RepID=UPI002606A698|nr:DUF1345 domain-containing protein [Methylovulum sp.]MDD2723310.1 DUF1345 domain-containing protein [Methylovulum sp.]MDD5126354.1 DUF1345 domain-containing protein [Methylovulum sp.]